MMDVTGVRKIKICDQKKDTEQMDTFCLLFWVGCIHEEKGKNGTAHILEHMIVHYISERAKRYYGKPIVCVGKTEYDHIMIRFDVGNEVVGISGEVFCLHIIDEIIEGRMLSVELFNISLAEVKGEAKDKKRTIEEQKIIVKRLTDNAISNHPVGDEYDLSQIRFGDIKNFFDYVVLGEEWGVVLLGDNIKDYKEIIRSHNIVEKKIYDYGKEQNGNTEVITNGIYRYFFPSYSKDEIEYIEKMIIMNALENSGFFIPKDIKEHPTNFGKEVKHYDQIAFNLHLEEGVEILKKDVKHSGAFDFTQSVYRDEDYKEYIDVMPEKDLKEKDPVTGKKKTEKRTGSAAKTYFHSTYRIGQMSDHMPLWVELNVDFSEKYIEKQMEFVLSKEAEAAKK